MRLLVAGFGLLLLTATAGADSDFFKEFKTDYGILGSELSSKPPAELADISDFVYEKDVATFTFKSGKIYLLREIDGRATAAIFLGEGHASIEIPSHVERQSLWYAARDSVVDETFEVAFVNFSDDFDLKLKERFQFEKTVLPWRDFNKAQQGEFFFQPQLYHAYDHYFELLRSHFERKADGFFFIDFNRYGFSFDPNRPEEVIVAYEHEGGDQELTEGAVMQRKEKNIYGDLEMSHVAYPTTMVSREGTLIMSGLDGKHIDQAQIDLSFTVNVDSLRFVSLFLHHNLTVDSVYYKGAPCDFQRRGSFTFMGVIMPEYRHQGDTVTLRLWYDGNDYVDFLPFVEDPTPSRIALKLDVPSGYNYCLPSARIVEGANPKRRYYECEPPDLYRLFTFQPLASGFDTLTAVSDIGVTLEFLKSSHVTKNNFTCFILDQKYEKTVTDAFNCLAGRLGPPPGSFVVDVYPQPGSVMPGLISVSQTECYVDNTGGLTMNAANMGSRLWFGALMRPMSDREFWLLDALPDYLSLYCVLANINPDVFFAELRSRRNYVYRLLDLDADKPLATGRRVDHRSRASKGAWIMHMLYCMMLDDPGTFGSNRTFWSFINELRLKTNNATFSNADFKALAEKYTGQSLDDFFEYFVFGRNIPVFKVDYKVVERSDGHYITAEVDVQDTPADFQMPVIMRVEPSNGQSVYERHTISAPHTSLELGPYSFKPKKLIFNEYHSVLSKDK